MPNDFFPDWVSPPGDTIRDLLIEHKLSIPLEKLLDLNSEDVSQLLQGTKRIDSSLALRLATVFGGSSVFWLTRDQQYLAGLKHPQDKWRQAMRRACQEPTLLDALTWIANWEADRAIYQALKSQNDGVPTIDGRKWDTCFKMCLDGVLKMWGRQNRNPLNSRHRCSACHKLTRNTTAGCDHCDLEDK